MFRLRLAVWVVCALASFQANAQSRASEFLMFIDGIEGESQQEAGAIDVMSFSWGIQSPVGAPTGGGGGAGKVSFQELNVSKPLDKSSAALMKSCATGQHLPSVKLVARKAGGKQQEYLIVTLKDVVITSFAPAGSTGSDKPTESVSLDYGRIEMEVKEVRANGTTVPFKTCFDVRAMRPCD